MDTKHKPDKLIYTTYLQKEENELYPESQGMFLAYEYLRAGDRRSIPEGRKAYQAAFASRLSRDPLQLSRFSFLYSATLSLHYAVEGGLTEEQAYSIYRLYVRQMDAASSIEEIESLHQAMLTDFTEQVSGMVKTGQIALPLYDSSEEEATDEENLSPTQQTRAVAACADYIYYHLYEKIYLEDLAEHVKLSPNYLSTLFHNKRGMTIQAYIRSRKVEAASNMLLYSDFSIGQISEILSFSSTSHFIRVFRQETGLTPKVFQEQNYHNRRSMLKS